MTAVENLAGRLRVVRRPDPELGLDVIVDPLRGVAAVQVSLWTGSGTFEATGGAKRHPRDVDDRDLAVELACARALYGLAAQLHVSALGRVQDHGGEGR